MFAKLTSQSVENFDSLINPFEVSPSKGGQVQDSQNSEFVTFQEQNDSSNIVLKEYESSSRQMKDQEETS